MTKKIPWRKCGVCGGTRRYLGGACPWCYGGGRVPDYDRPFPIFFTKRHCGLWAVSPQEVRKCLARLVRPVWPALARAIQDCQEYVDRPDEDEALALLQALTEPGLVWVWEEDGLKLVRRG